MSEERRDDPIEPRPAGAGEEEASPSQQRGGSVEASSSPPPAGEAVEQDIERAAR